MWKCGSGHKNTLRAALLADRAHVIADLALHFVPGIDISHVLAAAASHVHAHPGLYEYVRLTPPTLHDQLLDVSRAVKRMEEERKLLIERRDRERELGQLDDAYDASAESEPERHDGLELEQQSSDADNDGQDEPVASHGHTATAEVTGHHGTAPGPQRFAPTSAVSGASESLTSETTVTAFPPPACTDGASDGHMFDDAPALPETATGGDGCSSGDHQVLCFPLATTRF